jgi:hypothetical protein
VAAALWSSRSRDRNKARSFSSRREELLETRVGRRVLGRIRSNPGRAKYTFGPGRGGHPVVGWFPPMRGLGLNTCQNTGCQTKPKASFGNLKSPRFPWAGTPRRFRPRAESFRRLGVQNHGSVRPRPRLFPGAAAPHVSGPDDSTLSLSPASHDSSLLLATRCRPAPLPSSCRRCSSQATSPPSLLLPGDERHRP